MPTQKISIPNQFKKIKSDKPKTKREDRVDNKEEKIVKWYKKEPSSTIIFNICVGFGCTICFLAFSKNFSFLDLFLKFLACSFISYMSFEEIPILFKRLKA